MIVCETKKCTGCMACMNICPFGAITKGISPEYKDIPVINKTLCKNCGLCKKVCPELNCTSYNTVKSCFAAWKKDGLDVKNCASGGVSAALNEYAVSIGGTVFGAGYKDGRVCHILAEESTALEKIKGSKYVQSDIGFSYKKAKELLEEDKFVVFSGTPCIISGLREYLGRDYDNLLTVDIVCHGVASPKFLEDYLTELKLSGKCSEVRFRGEEDYYFTVYNKDEIVFKESAVTNIYYRAYYNKILMRDNCHSCRYTTEKNRPGDITLGDFWGVDRSDIKAEGKISLVLLNTEKGMRFFKKAQIPSMERPISEAISGNAQLKAPCPVGEDREVFLKNYHLGFIKAVNKTSVKENISKNRRNLILFKIKDMIKKGLKL